MGQGHGKTEQIFSLKGFTEKAAECVVHVFIVTTRKIQVLVQNQHTALEISFT